MAFMMPVMKNEFDIYKSRTRATSECSNPGCRSRKVSECSRSDGPSLSSSPDNHYLGSSPAHRSAPIAMNRLASRPQFSRNSSRTSQTSLITSPTKSAGNSPPKAAEGSQTSLHKFHLRLAEKLRKSLRRAKSTEGRS